MQVVYTGELPPEALKKSIFLAGPTPRSEKVKSWRPEALKILRKLGYEGVVFVPEYRDGVIAGLEGNIEWEEMCLNMADCIVFWVPRNIKGGMPAFTTNIEWGRWENSGKVVFGAPPRASKMSYMKHYAKKLQVPLFNDLHETIESALGMVGEGALRAGGERKVPLHIWRTASFQQWYRAQRSAGNRLDGARVEWAFRVGPDRSHVFIWALRVNVFITREGRNKINEVVIGRPDISTILMYRLGETLNNSDIVLVREFRSPASNNTGFVWELPGGSSFKADGDLTKLAADECMEETGLTIEPCRLRRHEARQLASTLSAHKAHLFSVQIGEQELDFLRKQYGVAYGVLKDTERTYIEIMKLGEIRKRANVDWSMLGMILSVLAK